MPGRLPGMPAFLSFLRCWLFVFPFGCWVGVCSFEIQTTMSGRVLAIHCNPVTFILSMILLGMTCRSTYRYFQERVHPPQSTESGPPVSAGHVGPLWDSEVDG